MYKPYMGVCLMVSWIVAGQAAAQTPSPPPLSMPASNGKSLLEVGAYNPILVCLLARDLSPSQ